MLRLQTFLPSKTIFSRLLRHVIHFKSHTEVSCVITWGSLLLTIGAYSSSSWTVRWVCAKVEHRISPRKWWVLCENTKQGSSACIFLLFTRAWNSVLLSVYVTIIGLTAIQSFLCLSEDPKGFATSVATSAISQSAVLMNLVILATGQETVRKYFIASLN